MTQPSSDAVFLSYASQDAEAAQRIAEALTAAGVEVWFDQSSLKGGAAWDAEIRRRIHECALFVPIISANTESRLEGYFRLEWRLAEQRTHLMAKGVPFLVPVVIDGTRDADARVPDNFIDVQWTRLPDGEGGAAFALHVKGLLGQSVPPTMPRHSHAGVIPVPERRGRVSTALIIGAIVAILALISTLLTLNALRVERAQRKDAADAGTAGPASAPPVSPSAPRTAVAVLPFANLTGDASKEYLGDGMAEELINTLAKVQGLKVPARTSSFAYKGRNVNIRDIAKDLQVGTILEGSVRAAGKRIRITAQLINAQDGLHLWSETYDEEFTDIFKLQDKLATEIAKALRVSLGSDASDSIPHTAGTTDVEAYNLNLRGQSIFVEAGKAEQLTRALELFQQAVQRDPNYARAWSGISRVQFALAARLRSDAHRIESEHAARRALALDPDDSFAHVMLGQIGSSSRNFVEAENQFRAALASAPSDAVPHSTYVTLLANVGHLRDAVAEARHGYSLAPASAYAVGKLAHALSVRGSEAEAASWVTVARALYGNEAGFQALRMAEFRVALKDGQMDAATDAVVKAAAPSEVDRTALSLVIAAIADPTKQPAALAIRHGFYPKVSAPKLGTDVSLQWSADSAPACTAAYLYAAAKAHDAAYDLADRCLPAAIGVGAGDLWAPETAAFRRDPRFAGYVERLGLHLIEYWQKFGPPDDCDLSNGKLTCH